MSRIEVLMRDWRAKPRASTVYESDRCVVQEQERLPFPLHVVDSHE